MKVFKKKNYEYSKAEKVITSILSFIVFGVVGGVIRLFGDSIFISNEFSLMLQLLPYVLVFGVTASILGYRYPRVLNIIMCFIPFSSIS